jgi:hypothetical protein
VQNRQHQTDRCKCWGQTRVLLTIQHCPSLTGLVREECDKMTRFTLDHTLLSQFGKPHFSCVEFIKGESNDVSSVPAEVDASSLPSAQ